MARTWFHPATGTSGADLVPPGTSGVWPLNRHHRDRRDPLIKILRRGARHHGHWLAVDPDPTRTADPGRFTVRHHRDDLLPPDTRWVEATVSAAPAAHLAYPALVATGYTITGDDVIPRFTRQTVEQMADDLTIVRRHTTPGTLAVLAFSGTVLHVYRGTDHGPGTRQRDIDQVHPDADGLYAVGAYLWPWHQESDQPPGR